MSKTRLLARHMAREIDREETVKIGGGRKCKEEVTTTTWQVIGGVQQLSVDDSGWVDD